MCEAFYSEIEEFSKVVNGISKSEVKCIDSCRAIQVSEACHLSLINNCVVDIKYGDNHGECNYQIHNLHSPKSV